MECEAVSTAVLDKQNIIIVADASCRKVNFLNYAHNYTWKSGPSTLTFWKTICL